MGKNRTDRSIALVGEAPERLKIGGRIASPNTVTSPLTGTRANAFVWHLSDAPPSPGARPGEGQDALATRQWGAESIEVVVGGEHRVHVPWRALTLVAPDAEPPMMELPQVRYPELGNLPARGVRFYSETSFAEGDEVEIDAWIARAQREPAFRGTSDAPSAPFVVRTELGDATLTQYVVPTSEFNSPARRLARTLYSLLPWASEKADVASGTDLAIALSAIGFAIGACLFVASFGGFIGHPIIHGAVLFGALLVQAVAYKVHPSTYVEEGEDKVPVVEITRSAPAWAIALCGAAGVAVLAAFVDKTAMLGVTAWEPIRGDFARPDRIIAALAALWYACSLAMSLSAREFRRRSTLDEE